MTFDEYENEDVETVFESIRAMREKHERDQHQELLTSFWRDGLRIGELNHYDPKDWVAAPVGSKELKNRLLGDLGAGDGR